MMEIHRDTSSYSIGCHVMFFVKIILWPSHSAKLLDYSVALSSQVLLVLRLSSPPVVLRASIIIYYVHVLYSWYYSLLERQSSEWEQINLILSWYSEPHWAIISQSPLSMESINEPFLYNKQSLLIYSIIDVMRKVEQVIYIHEQQYCTSNPSEYWPKVWW